MSETDKGANRCSIMDYAQDHPLRQSPFPDPPKMRNAVWMEPRPLAEVTYAESVDGMLRAPTSNGSTQTHGRRPK